MSLGTLVLALLAVVIIGSIILKIIGFALAFIVKMVILVGIVGVAAIFIQKQLKRLQHPSDDHHRLDS
ncbi:hypothetical protein K6V98_07635 [Collinsella sp. AGMB00827]|uniref:Uncharacterized protein n=1 Tax=Collinsella ureilytica TaxID=2869515 RepID=A0ABS7MP94_9ACTN|nr:hypothetical protein [Collinsella urealyticum]MBY4798215.1 hypothetical protein [Collinsella urealyticum]